MSCQGEEMRVGSPDGPPEDAGVEEGRDRSEKGRATGLKPSLASSWIPCRQQQAGPAALGNSGVASVALPGA